MLLNRYILMCLKKVKSKVSIPVSVKFGIYHSNILGMAEKMKANGASGIVMFNRFYEPDINIETLELTASEIFSPLIFAVHCVGSEWFLRM